MHDGLGDGLLELRADVVDVGAHVRGDLVRVLVRRRGALVGDHLRHLRMQRNFRLL